MFQLRSTSRRPASKSRRICRAKRLFIETLEARQLLATINVGPGLDFATIQEAVNNARPNDVLEIVNGTYNEAINLNSMGSAVQSSNGNLTIRGESLDTIVVSPGGPALFNSAA
ncbi:MAG: pectin methylesterase-like acyl-CoA thioesterase, partial [Pirellulaceae bacterium]